MIIGIALQRVRKPILLLEEPELSLHPRLQRRLMATLDKFAHQVFVTTHSNHIIDGVGGHTRLLHVRKTDLGSDVHAIDESVVDLLRDIGARPSSLAEANAVIWVEGPSDAIYLRHWISTVDREDEFTEGIDFVFAFHAGSLLKHASAARAPGVLSVFEEINPNYFLVLDLDPDNDGEPSHEYTRPWIGHVHAWVTQSKEVEGYLSDEALCKAVNGTLTAKSDASKSLRTRLAALNLPKSWSNRKVDLARAVINLTDEPVLHASHETDLRKNLRRLRAFLREARADGLEATQEEITGEA